MPVLSEFRIKSCNAKNNIYVRQWTPDGEPIGVVQICHGIGEHIRRYDDFMKYLAEHGYIVCGDDHLGHGMTIANSSELGCVGDKDGWDMMVGDMRKLYEHMHKEYPGLPYFNFGHSMGSFLTRSYIIRYHDGPDGVILSGTGHQPTAVLFIASTIAKRTISSKGGSHPSKFLNSLAFGSYNKKIPDSSSEFDWLSTDKAVVKAYDEDPLCGPVPTAGLFYAMFSGLKEITKFSNVQRVNKDMPLYLYAGCDDPVGNYGKGVERTYKDYVKAGIQDIKIKLYPGSRHECHNEFCKSDVYSDVLAWIEEKRKK